MANGQQGRVISGEGMCNERGIDKRMLGMEHRFLEEAALFWTRITRKGVWCKWCNGSVGGGNGDGLAMLFWSQQGYKGSERATMKTLDCATLNFVAASSSTEGDTTKMIRVGSLVSDAARRALFKAVIGSMRSASLMGAVGVRRLYLPASSDQSEPEAPMRRSVAWGEFQ